MYKITITRSAEKDLKKLDRQVKNRIVNEILSLANEPRPHGCRKVVSEERISRIRSGDWRIGYEIDDPGREVTVIRIVTVASFMISDRIERRKEGSSRPHADPKYLCVRLSTAL